ncbi:MAG: hypothetical protein H7A44_05515 [Opitutaceae bacterium]|nr:hypothetical protein [Cephaloticoccus sp.]MCP5529882.1 hypothetical protein [Opitutaceae bacterium]
MDSESALPAPTPPVTTNEDRTVAVLTYLTIIGFIIAIVIHANKKTALGAYHLRQGLGLTVTGLVLWVAGMIIAFVPVLNLVMLLWPFISIGLFILWLFGLIAAAQGQQKPIPLLGEHYQKWFAGTFA